MDFIYTPDKAPVIINHESKMLKIYSEIIDSYKDVFNSYDCTLEVGIRWENSFQNKYSCERLPFENGYQCYIYCEVKMNGKEVHVKSFDGEVDFYSLSSSWVISSIDRHFCRLQASLCSTVDDVGNNIFELYKLLISAF